VFWFTALGGQIAEIQRAEAANTVGSQAPMTDFNGVGIQFIEYPAAFHAPTPPSRTLTFVKPCSRYFAA